MKYSRSLTTVLVFRLDTPRGGSRGGAKLGHGGPLLQRTSSDWKATATNQIHSSDLEAFGKKCCYFWFHSEASLDVVLDFVIWVYFDAIYIDFYVIKSFFCINFV